MAYIRFTVNSTNYDFPIYNLGTSINYLVNALPTSQSQSGVFYPQTYSSRNISNIKKIFNFTIEYMDDEQKEDLLTVYEQSRDLESITFNIVNNIETVFSGEVIFNEGIQINQPDINFWNATISIREY